MGGIVCFGELLLRLSAPGRELLLQSGHLDVHVGGAEANVAVALAQLGHTAAMISRVPDNPLGRAAVEHLRRYGVDVSGVAAAPGRMGLYFLCPGSGVRAPQITYDREYSSFALAGPEDFDWNVLLDGADLLHFSGITPALGEPSSQLALAAVDAAVARGITFSFDGNYREQLWRRWNADPRPLLSQFVQRAEILFGNHRDISLLLGREFAGESEEERRHAAEAAFAAFPQLRMIASTVRHVADADTHGIAARIDERGGGVQTREIMVTGIVDRIGAGDAFAAGVLHGLQLGRDVEWIAEAGLALACLKHSLPGDASLFRPQDIEAFQAGERDVRR
jgi:2-dehydro-3-deoxygluconokinase